MTNCVSHGRAVSDDDRSGYTIGDDIMTAIANKPAKIQGMGTLSNDSTDLRNDPVSSICETVTPSSPFKISLEQYAIKTLQQARDAIKSVTMGTGKVNDKARAGLHAINLDGATVLGWTGKQAMDNRISISEVIADKKAASKPVKASKVSGGIMTLEQANQVANITSEDLDAMVSTLHGMSRTGLKGKADIRFIGDGQIVMTAGGNNGKGHYHVNQDGQVSTVSASDSSKMKRAFDRSERFARVSDKPESKLTDNDKKFLKEYKLEQNDLN